jgi:hypothetical protein
MANRALAKVAAHAANSDTGVWYAGQVVSGQLRLRELPPGMHDGIFRKMQSLDGKDPASIEPVWLALAEKLTVDMENSVAGQPGAFAGMKPRDLSRWEDLLMVPGAKRSLARAAPHAEQLNAGTRLLHELSPAARDRLFQAVKLLGGESTKAHGQVWATFSEKVTDDMVALVRGEPSMYTGMTPEQLAPWQDLLQVPEAERRMAAMAYQADMLVKGELKLCHLPPESRLTLLEVLKSFDGLTPQFVGPVWTRFAVKVQNDFIDRPGGRDSMAQGWSTDDPIHQTWIDYMARR